LETTDQTKEPAAAQTAPRQSGELSIRHILHADLDAFYAAVEVLDSPELAGKAVMVGGDPENRGVVATASYEARAFGIHSAMPMKTAVRLCPQGIIVHPRFDRYRELSRAVMDVFHEFTELVEPLSMDEAYLDITELVDAGRLSLAVALDLKNRVHENTGLTLSVGAGTSRSVAKIASDLHKPDCLIVVAPGEEREFLAPLPVGKLWGIGPKTGQRLRADGIETIGDLAAQSTGWFQRRFGKRAQDVRSRAMGEDREPVHTHRESKSVSAESTFATDLSGEDNLYPQLTRLAGRVAQHLEGKQLKGKTVTVKARLSDFTTFTRQTTLPYPTGSDTVILETAWRLFSKELTPDRAFRLLGVGVSGFTEEEEFQLPLFGEELLAEDNVPAQ
jgi:DNA polymerase-4